MSVPNRYFAPSAFLSTGWEENVLISVDEGGWITDIAKGKKDGQATTLRGPTLPGMLNVHSHAFQRALAGLTERATGEKDSFWTWRETMYQFLERLTPEDHEAIAKQLYVEMLKAGYTSVAEFHYVHHQGDGKPFAERALVSRHIIQAALDSGIAITHLPVLYAHSGFGGQAPHERQKRFINDAAGILDIVKVLKKTYQSEQQVSIGLAHHSLRAVNPELLEEATHGMLTIDPSASLHIHIAEQLKEVTDCLAWCGQKPVEWLLDHVEVNEHWCLVHATHLSDEETRRLAATGAVAGLCPSTEANLGDGFFGLPAYLQAGGRFGIGSDSQISVSPIEELRWLEYGQRLLRRERAVVRGQQSPSVGANLYQRALAGGAAALGRAAGALELGKRADFIVLDPASPALVGKTGDQIFDALIFAGNQNPISDVIAGGKHVVQNFRHGKEDAIFREFCRSMQKALS